MVLCALYYTTDTGNVSFIDYNKDRQYVQTFPEFHTYFREVTNVDLMKLSYSIHTKHSNIRTFRMSIQ